MTSGQFLDDSIFRHRVLSREEEHALLVEVAAERAIQERAERERDKAVKERLLSQVTGQARTKLVLHNLRLAARLATKYRGRGLDFDDLVSEAVQGILKAADLFDPERKNKFSTYASWWVIQYIQRAISYQGRTVRIPNHVCAGIRKMIKYQARYWQKHGRAPKRRELIRHLKCTGEWVDEYIKSMEQKCLSMDRSVESSSSASHNLVTFHVLLTDERSADPCDSLVEKERAEVLRAVLLKLPVRLRVVIQLRFGLDGPPLTLQQIADREGVSKERVRQIEAKALDKLRRLVRLEPAEA